MSSPAAQCLGQLSRYLPYQTFNKVQEAVIPSLFSNDNNCLIAAPTGSGKTVLLEVAMLRLFRDRLAKWDASAPNVSFAVPPTANATTRNESRARKYKAVYICPIKALANEKYEHWRSQFPSLAVVIETGDQMQQRSTQASRGDTTDGAAAVENDDMVSVAHADVLITTPERWDSITRRWKEKEVMAIVNSVGLLLLDEVHTVQEERGAAMEAIVSRVKVIQAATAHDVVSGAATRIVAISGTLPNIRDMAEWLAVTPEMTFAFSAADRPVPLTIKVISYAHDSANPFAFHRFLAFKIFSLIQQFSEGKPTLVFCASRKEVTSSAVRLTEDIRSAATQRGQLAQLQPTEEARRLAQQASDKQLRSCLLTGVGFHHAAMTLNDRLLVERMFRDQYIAVVCSTTTLALGVNLPAHLVVIKGTTFFANGQCQDMPVSEVMQMCGRAGRPGLDVHGVALVLTTQRKSYLYETLRNGTVALTCVESHLHKHMIEHVNAEVGLRTIQSFASAMDWAKTTFFWIRLRKCPRHYGLEFATKEEEEEFSAEGFMETLMERVLRVLVEEGCVKLSHTEKFTCSQENWPGKDEGAATTRRGAGHGPETEKNGLGEEKGRSATLDFSHPSVVFEPTRLGKAMSRMYILFDTVCTLNAELAKRGVLLSRATTTNSDTVAEEEAEPQADENEAAGVADAGEEDEEGAAGQQEQQQKERKSATAARSDKRFTLQETLQLLCRCQELVEVRLRQGDRGPLNEINRAVRYPLHSGRRGGREVREDWHKAYLLVQAHVGLLPITEVSLRNDSQRLWSVVPRVSRFLEEYAWAQTPSFSFAWCANVLARSMERRVWPDGPVLRQLQHVSDAVAKSLLRGGYRGFESLQHVDARQVEVLCSRLPPFGNQVLTQLRSLPRVQLELCLQQPVKTATTQGGHVGLVRVFLMRCPAEEEEEKGTDVCSSDMGVNLNATRFSSVKPQENAPACVEVVKKGKRQGGAAARPEATAWSSGRALLIVGAPLTDTVLLKRFVPLCAPLTACDATPANSHVSHEDNSDNIRGSGDISTGAKNGEDCIEVASFTFHVPDALRSDRLSLPADATKIEARCLILHMVGLDVAAHVTCAAPVATSHGELLDVSETSGPEKGAAAAERFATLDPYIRAAKKAPSREVVKSAPAESTSSAGGVAVQQTPASAAVAAEARDAFNALLADMTYVASSERTPRKRPQQPSEAPQDGRKRTKKDSVQVGFADATGGSGGGGGGATIPDTATPCTPGSQSMVEDVDVSAGGEEGCKHSDTPAALCKNIFPISKMGDDADAESDVVAVQANVNALAEKNVSQKTQTSPSNVQQQPMASSVQPECAGGVDAGITPSRRAPIPVRLRRSVSPPATCPSPLRLREVPQPAMVSALPDFAEAPTTSYGAPAPPFYRGGAVERVRQAACGSDGAYSAHHFEAPIPQWRFTANIPMQAPLNATAAAAAYSRPVYDRPQQWNQHTQMHNEPFHKYGPRENFTPQDGAAGGLQYVEPRYLESLVADSRYGVPRYGSQMFINDPAYFNWQQQEQQQSWNGMSVAENRMSYYEQTQRMPERGSPAFYYHSSSRPVEQWRVPCVDRNAALYPQEATRRGCDSWVAAQGWESNSAQFPSAIPNARQTSVVRDARVATDFSAYSYAPPPPPRPAPPSVSRFEAFRGASESSTTPAAASFAGATTYAVPATPTSALPGPFRGNTAAPCPPVQNYNSSARGLPPRASSTAGSGAFTPHVRRSAMVPQSWWQ